MKRVWIALGILALAAAGWYGYSQYTARQQAADEAAAAAAQEPDPLENVIWASGKLQPEQWADLAPVNSGRVAAIHAAEGDWVEQGDLLLELDAAVLESQVAAAAAAVAEAEAALAKLQAGATPADLAAAEAEVEAARAQVALAAGQLAETQSAVQSAQTAVETAQRQYAELASHPTAGEAAVARAEVAVAQAAVSQAQAAYNLVRGDPQIGARPESMALQQATAALEAAQARADLTAAGPSAEQLAVAQSAVNAARVQVEAAQSRLPGAEANVQAALAGLAGAEAALDKLRSGATAEDIAMAEAHVDSAEATLESVRAQLRLNQVFAPFDGQIGKVYARVGELTAPGQATILLGDPTTLYVETTDLRETDVTKLQPEMAVELTFDALPNRILPGHIIHVAPVSSVSQGSTNYTVHIALDEQEPSLRWGMTAFVNIQAQ